MSIVIHGMDMPTDKPIALIINPDGQVIEVGNYDQTWEASALERDRWISVEEPPEHGKKYLVCAIGTYYGVKIVETARFSNVWGWMTYEGEPMEAEVTHYRPLPEPPKEET